MGLREDYVAQVGQLGEQLSVLRASYRQLAGLPEAPTKVDFLFYVAQNHLKASSLMVDKKTNFGNYHFGNSDGV